MPIKAPENASTKTSALSLCRTREVRLTSASFTFLFPFPNQWVSRCGWHCSLTLQRAGQLQTAARGTALPPPPPPQHPSAPEAPRQCPTRTSTKTSVSVPHLSVFMHQSSSPLHTRISPNHSKGHSVHATTPGPCVTSLNHLRHHWLLTQECLTRHPVQAQVCATGWTGFGLAVAPA